MISPLEWGWGGGVGTQCNVALDRNQGLGYNTLLPGGLYRACPHIVGIDSYTHYPTFNIVGLGAGQNRPRTESPVHNRPNKVGDSVSFRDDYIQPCYMFFVVSSCENE